MIIYLPYPKFEASAKALDLRRLGNQRRDVHVLLRSLLEDRVGPKNLRLFSMWRGYEAALANYGVALSAEIDSRGYEDPFYFASFEVIHRFNVSFLEATVPPWLGDAALHASHRALLKRETTEALAKAQFRLKNPRMEDLELPASPEEQLAAAKEEFEWYASFGWKESVSTPLLWPQS